MEQHQFFLLLAVIMLSRVLSVKLMWLLATSYIVLSCVSFVIHLL